jgi:long-chain fatty acid transport protein
MSDKAMLSLHYRSRVDHAVNGDSSFSGPLAPRGTISSEATTRVTLPDTISGNFSFLVNSKVKILAGIYYTLWSTIQSIEISNIASPSGPVTESLHLAFKNTWRLVLGSEVYFSNKFLMRFGVGIDQTPTKLEDRSIRLPDNDRIAFAVGARYVFNKILSLDLGYTHLFIRKVDIDSTVNTFTQVSTVKGNTKNVADLLSMQITAKIC